MAGRRPSALPKTGDIGHCERVDIQWFPGHMTRAKNIILENRDKVDVFLELVDARAPASCRNPLLGELIGDRPRLIILNKVDLADPHITALWKRFFEGQSHTAAVLVSSKERRNLPAIPSACEELCRSRRWFGLRKVRGMIVGIPNVGKSTLINALAGAHKASVAPQPGHTRGIQRIKINDQFELLDTPGILWHKFDDPQVGRRLAILGSIKDDVVDFYHLTLLALDFLASRYPKAVSRRFKLEDGETSAEAILESVAKKRGFLVKGGEADLERACQAVMNDLRTGLLGRISLESPSETQKNSPMEPVLAQDSPTDKDPSGE